MYKRQDPTDADRVTVTCSGFRDGVKVFRSVDGGDTWSDPVSYTHLRAHETVLDLVCRLLLEKKTNKLHISQVSLINLTCRF